MRSCIAFIQRLKPSLFPSVGPSVDLSVKWSGRRRFVVPLGYSFECMENNTCNTIIEKASQILHLISFNMLHTLIGSNLNMAIQIKRHFIFDFVSFNC